MKFSSYNSREKTFYLTIHTVHTVHNQNFYKEGRFVQFFSLHLYSKAFYEERNRILTL